MTLLNTCIPYAVTCLSFLPAYKALHALLVLIERAKLKDENSAKKKKSPATLNFLEKLFVDIAVKETAKHEAELGEKARHSFIYSSTHFLKIYVTSGIKDPISEIGFCCARLKFVAILGLFGCLFGLVISLETAFVFGVVGALFGFKFGISFLRKHSKLRQEDMQNNLHEMLDIVLIGVRAGLSFDRSLKLYVENFSCNFASELRCAQLCWESSLKTRDDALRDVAKTYDSLLLMRLVESICRCLNLGTSLQECLEACGVEAKAMYKAERETIIQKAPVKMMIPTATLILPAMLIMVLGPVLLEFINGGI